VKPTSRPSSPLTNADAIRAWEAGADRVGDFDKQGDGARRWLLNPTIFALLGEPKGRPTSLPCRNHIPYCSVGLRPSSPTWF
jgi:hypothetical protein